MYDINLDIDIAKPFAILAGSILTWLGCAVWSYVKIRSYYRKRLLPWMTDDRALFLYGSLLGGPFALIATSIVYDTRSGKNKPAKW